MDITGEYQNSILNHHIVLDPVQITVLISNRPHLKNHEQFPSSSERPNYIVMGLSIVLDFYSVGNPQFRKGIFKSWASTYTSLSKSAYTLSISAWTKIISKEIGNDYEKGMRAQTNIVQAESESKYEEKRLERTSLPKKWGTKHSTNIVGKERHFVTQDGIYEMLSIDA